MSNTFLVLLAQLHYVILKDFNHVLVNVEIKCWVHVTFLDNVDKLKLIVKCYQFEVHNFNTVKCYFFFKNKKTVFFVSKVSFIPVNFQHHYSSLQSHMILQKSSNRMICCSRNIYDYNQCWRQLCYCIFFCGKHVRIGYWHVQLIRSAMWHYF